MGDTSARLCPLLEERRPLCGCVGLSVRCFCCHVFTPALLWLLQGVSSIATKAAMRGVHKKGFYCVIAPPGCVSATTGIYSTWGDACAHGAQGVSGVQQKSFGTRAAAEAYIAGETCPRQKPSIEHPSCDDDRGRGSDGGSPQGRDRRDRDDSRDRERRRHRREALGFHYPEHPHRHPSSEEDRRDRRRDRRRSRSRSDSR